MTPLVDPENPKAPHLWSIEALSAKAQLYLHEMQGTGREAWQYCLWSCFMLELVARAALSSFSPLLQAGGSGENAAANLVYATGRKPKKPSKFVPQSRDISAVINLLEELLPAFGKEQADFCRAHVALRNGEVHSGDTRLSSTGSSNWQPKFYDALSVLLPAFGEDMEHWLGEEESGVAKTMMEAAKDSTAKEVLGQVAQHQASWQQLSAAEQASNKSLAASWATRERGHRVPCPACGSTALLTGKASAPPRIRHADGDIIEEQEYLPAGFQCLACSLKIAGLSKLIELGLGTAYKHESRSTPEEFYGSGLEPQDPYEGFDDDNNEPW